MLMSLLKHCPWGGHIHLFLQIFCSRALDYTSRSPDHVLLTINIFLFFQWTIAGQQGEDTRGETNLITVVFASTLKATCLQQPSCQAVA
jgi:hypothetical protein